MAGPRYLPPVVVLSFSSAAHDLLAEMEDLEFYTHWLSELDLQTSLEVTPPNGEYLLDQSSREKQPHHYSGEELGLEALTSFKFIMPESNWTWYASKFDGENIFFVSVDGFETELSCFWLKELNGPMGLKIERDLHFEPKSLSKLFGDATAKAIKKFKQLLIILKL